MKAVVFDLDGTLANLNHRLHYIQNPPKNYDAFFDAMVDDKPVEPLLELLEVLEVHYDSVLCSGRPDSHREITEQWLRKQGYRSRLRCGKLYMRKTGDYRPDHIIKKEMLQQMRADGYDPFLVVDDRSSVVAMWRAEGLTCLQCADWEEQTAISKQGLLTLMVGPCGAGKTSWLHGQFIAGTDVFIPENFDIHLTHLISSDEIRFDLFGDFRDQSNNTLVFEAVHAQAKARLQYGLPVIIDATHLRRKDRLSAVELTKGGPVRYIVMDRPMEEKLRDAGWRSKELLERHAQTFRSQIKDILKGDGLSNVEVVDLIKE